MDFKWIRKIMTAWRIRTALNGIMTSVFLKRHDWNCAGDKPEGNMCWRKNESILVYRIGPEGEKEVCVQ